MTAQFGFMRGVAGKNCQIYRTTMDAEINRWPKRSDRLRNHDQRTQEELRYAPSYPRHFDFHRRAVVCEGGRSNEGGICEPGERPMGMSAHGRFALSGSGDCPVTPLVLRNLENSRRAARLALPETAVAIVVI
jgi:hypothetical protein